MSEDNLPVEMTQTNDPLAAWRTEIQSAVDEAIKEREDVFSSIAKATASEQDDKIGDIRQKLEGQEAVMTERMRAIDSYRNTFGLLLVAITLTTFLSGFFGWRTVAGINGDVKTATDNLAKAAGRYESFTKLMDIHLDGLIRQTMEDQQGVMDSLSSHLPARERQRLLAILDKDTEILTRIQDAVGTDLEESNGPLVSESSHARESDVSLLKDINRGLRELVLCEPPRRDPELIQELKTHLNNSESIWTAVSSAIATDPHLLKKYRVQADAYAQYALGTVQLRRFLSFNDDPSRLDRASEHFRSARQKDSSFARAYGSEGVILAKQFDILRENGDINDETVNARLRRLLSDAIDRYNDAIDYSFDERSQSISKNNMATEEMKLAKLELELKNFEDAKRAFDRALRTARDATTHQPNHPVVYATLAEIECEIVSAFRSDFDAAPVSAKLQKIEQILFLVETSHRSGYLGFGFSREEFADNWKTLFVLESLSPDYRERLFAAVEL
ncbi:MAG: hypothetical protein R3E01_08465 [Pirellulaceae bacterium]|nr:hypothetical protein [Planctomycetales bacterium]